MITLVIGRRGRGKTSLTMKIARDMTGVRAVMDARDMIHGPEWKTERIYVVGDAYEAVGEMLQGDTPIREVVYAPTEDDLEEAFTEWARAIKRLVLRFRGRRMVLVVDEASFYDLESKPFQWLAKCADRDKVHIFITAHRPQDIPTSIRSIADHWCVFAVRQEHDLKALRERSPELERLAASVSGHEYVWWNDSSSIVEAVNRKPQTWKINLSTGAN